MYIWFAGFGKQGYWNTYLEQTQVVCYRDLKLFASVSPALDELNTVGAGEGTEIGHTSCGHEDVADNVAYLFLELLELWITHMEWTHYRYFFILASKGECDLSSTHCFPILKQGNWRTIRMKNEQGSIVIVQSVYVSVVDYV